MINFLSLSFCKYTIFKLTYRNSDVLEDLVEFGLLLPIVQLYITIYIHLIYFEWKKVNWKIYEFLKWAQLMNNELLAYLIELFSMLPCQEVCSGWWGTSIIKHIHTTLIQLANIQRKVHLLSEIFVKIYDLLNAPIENLCE